LMIISNDKFLFKAVILSVIIDVIILSSALTPVQNLRAENDIQPRQRLSLNDDWKFYKYESPNDADDIIYDVRPQINDYNDVKPADTRPTESEEIQATRRVLKPWILPNGNDFIKDSTKQCRRPEGNPGRDFPFVQKDYDDSRWESVNLPHDWAIKGPFF